MYQHVCVHRLNKGNKKKTRTCLPPQEEPNIWVLVEPPKKLYLCYFFDEAASARSNLHIDMLWDLLGCAIVFYIQPCTDCFIGAMQRAYLRGVGNLSLYHRVCNFTVMIVHSSRSLRVHLPFVLLVVFRLSHVLYILYRHSYLGNKLLYCYNF